MSTRGRSVVAGWALLVGLPGLGSAQDAGLRLVGELRLRGEAERPVVVDTVDAFTLLRARLGLEATLSQYAKVFLQVQDARTFGEEASPADGSADRLDLHQGWLELARPVGTLSFSVRAGRQELGLGNERLLGPANWTNTGRAFDALTVGLGSKARGWQLTALAATVDERGRRLAGSVPGPEREDQLLLGSYWDTRILDAWLLFERAAEYRSFYGADRATAGARIELPAWRGLSAWAEGSYQFGNQVLSQPATAQDISAYLLGGRISWARPTSPLRALGIGIDYLSGDERPGDADYHAFNVMYHTGHKWYGYLDLFLDPAGKTGDRGLVDGIASATVQLAPAAPLAIDLHRFRTAAQRPPTCPGPLPCSSSEEARDLGWELDLTLPFSIGPNQRVQAGYSAYRNGAAAPLAGLGAESRWYHWGHLMVTFGFSGGVH